MSEEFHGESFALLTLHGKETLLEPLFKQHLNASIILTQAFDTDTLGTFSGEVKRQLTPKECAYRKAALACDLTGLRFGLGSEGSFFPSPYGFGTMNQEIITCVNQQQSWSVTGQHYDFSSARSETVFNLMQLNDFLTKTPSNQGLILQLSATQIAKGLYGEHAVHTALEQWLGKLNDKHGDLPQPVILGYDLRAHHCPERRIIISKACENLLARLQTLCPVCHTPGFWPDESIPGLECEHCGTETPCIKARKATCMTCQHTAITTSDEVAARQEFCPYCNP